jgi:type VI secretion system protein ImpI
MQLILDLVGADGQSTTQKSSVTFLQAGGTIGRTDTATWKLVDRSRHISGVHAEISYEEGVYYLTDRSTNGTFDELKNARLQKDEDYPIAHGDSFRIGNFVFKARILQDAGSFAHQAVGAPASVNHLIPDDEFLDVDPLSMLDESEADPADFSLNSFSTQPNDDFALNDFMDDMSEPFLSPTLTVEPADEVDSTALDELEISNPVLTRPVPVKQKKKTTQANPDSVVSHVANLSGSDLAVLGEALDFDFSTLTEAEKEQALNNIGALAKHAIQGLQQVLRTRAEIKNKLRLGSTMVQESSNNPLKLSGNYTQTLNCLLLGQVGYLIGPQAIRQALKDIQAHQVASFAASRTIIDSVFEQFSPSQLVYRFETSGKPGKWSNKDAHYWQQYQLHHQKIASDQEWRQSQFIKDYARVYEEQAQYINAAWSDFDAR